VCTRLLPFLLFPFFPQVYVTPPPSPRSHPPLGNFLNCSVCVVFFFDHQRLPYCGPVVYWSHKVFPLSSPVPVIAGGKRFKMSLCLLHLTHPRMVLLFQLVLSSFFISAPEKSPSLMREGTCDRSALSGNFPIAYTRSLPPSFLRSSPPPFQCQMDHQSEGYSPIFAPAFCLTMNS